VNNREEVISVIGGYELSWQDFVTEAEERFPGTAYFKWCGDMYRYVREALPSLIFDQESMDALADKIIESEYSVGEIARNEMNRAGWYCEPDVISGTVGCALTGDLESIFVTLALHSQGYDYYGGEVALVDGYWLLLPAIASSICAPLLMTGFVPRTVSWFDMAGNENEVEPDWWAVALSPLLSFADRRRLLKDSHHNPSGDELFPLFVPVADALEIDLEGLLPSRDLEEAREDWARSMRSIKNSNESWPLDDALEVQMRHAYLLWTVTNFVSEISQSSMSTSWEDLESDFPGLMNWAPYQLLVAGFWPPDNEHLRTPEMVGETGDFPPPVGGAFMRFCPLCGTKRVENANYCGKCAYCFEATVLPEANSESWEDESDLEEFEWASEVPYDLTFELDSDGFWVYWQPPTIFEGRIKGYQVEITNLETGKVHSEPAEEPPALVIAFIAKNFSRVSIRVRAFSMDKYFEFSDPVEVQLNHDPG
jgi:hypothetical protein